MNKQEQQLFFEQVIEQHKGILFKVARAYCAEENDREDVVQEMLIQVWQSIHKYNHQYKISTWLYRIALNVAISFYRKGRVRDEKRASLNENILEFSVDNAPGTEEQLQLLERFIDELNEMDKALMLLYLEDKSHSDIADILGISISNVGTKLSRIKLKLKTRFSQIKEFENE